MNSELLHAVSISAAVSSSFVLHNGVSPAMHASNVPVPPLLPPLPDGVPLSSEEQPNWAPKTPATKRARAMRSALRSNVPIARSCLWLAPDCVVVDSIDG